MKRSRFGKKFASVFLSLLFFADATVFAVPASVLTDPTPVKPRFLPGVQVKKVPNALAAQERPRGGGRGGGETRGGSEKKENPPKDEGGSSKAKERPKNEGRSDSSKDDSENQERRARESRESKEKEEQRAKEGAESRRAEQERQRNAEEAKKKEADNHQRAEAEKEAARQREEAAARAEKERQPERRPNPGHGGGQGSGRDQSQGDEDRNKPQPPRDRPAPPPDKQPDPGKNFDNPRNPGDNRQPRDGSGAKKPGGQPTQPDQPGTGRPGDGRATRRPPNDRVRSDDGRGARRDIEVPRTIDQPREVRSGRPTSSERIARPREADSNVVVRREVRDRSGRVIQQGVRMPQARVLRHLPAPSGGLLPGRDRWPDARRIRTNVLPIGRNPYYVGRYRVPIYYSGYYTYHWAEYYYWDRNYWCWHHDHFDWWYNDYYYWRCPHYGVYIDWGYPTVFTTHIHRNREYNPPSHVSPPQDNYSLLLRSVKRGLANHDQFEFFGDTLFFKHNETFAEDFYEGDTDRSHSDRFIDIEDDGDFLFYCSRHTTYFVVRLGDPTYDDEWDSRYNLYWSNRDRTFVTYIGAGKCSVDDQRPRPGDPNYRENDRQDYFPRR
ncbi:MAG: hypothetical protein HY401_05100 [Elusimicrobia bacterium]|nr:hypothetical protein [Elusimicrobiota bacterium]